MEFIIGLLFAVVGLVILIGVAGAIGLGLFHWYLYIRHTYRNEE